MPTNLHTDIKSWANTDNEEDAMNDDHHYLWEHMIQTCANRSYAGKTVLDYGCNQGGFLELLYAHNPYQKGVGVDIATQSLAIASQKLGGKPVEFNTPESLDALRSVFDVAFSHEVLYLLPDLAAHAAQMHKALKQNGVYYAAIGCHTDQPQWDEWVSLISSYSNVSVQSYSLDDYANAFMEAGFEVSVQPFKLSGFFPLKQNNPYFPRVTDTLRYYESDKVIFRFKKSNANTNINTGA